MEDEDSIPGLILRHGVTHLQCTPSMAGLLVLDERTATALGKLETLLIGGEAFPPALARQLHKFVKGEILNMYGPTETTIWSSTHPVPPDPSSVATVVDSRTANRGLLRSVDAARIPVGRPIANTQMYVVDENFQPAPIGIAGELVIGGAGVARGYLGRPELTAERFVVNPFPGGSGRLYRTGDLARYLPEGNIEVLGRLDSQAKIRGHRVELGEIEALLGEHDSVRQAAVVLKGNGNGSNRLVGYVVPREGEHPTQEQLRGFLQERLPEHMLPEKLVFTTSLPLTPNQKIDRRALQDLAEENGLGERDFEAPTTGVEEALAAIWYELLELPGISRRRNFFEAGGHSLTAMKLVVRVRQRLGVDLPLSSVFDHPTIAELAEAIGALTVLARADEPGGQTARAPAVPVGS